jgi:multidrug efflux pump subunit AcrA (membrane-fusion protein)
MLLQARRALLSAVLLTLLLALACSGRAKGSATYYCPMHPQVTSDKPADCQICGMHLVPKQSAPVPAATTKYVCPMHPQVTSDKPADCSICGMHLVPKQSAPVPAATTKYVCPMHPQVTSDKPADCSICGMHLVAVKVEAGGVKNETSPAGMSPVTLAPEAQARLGLTFGTVETRHMTRTIRASGRIVADETRIFRIIARVEGFIDQLFVQYAGQSVRKGQSLLGLYSLNLISLQQQFLNATPSDGRRYLPPPTPREAPAAEGSERGSEKAPERGEDIQRQRLKYWDFSDEQIDRILKTGKAENSLILQAPAGGVVTEKNAILGQKVFPGDTLLVITDLSAVWAEANVSETDIPSVKVGGPMEVSLPSLPGRTFGGKIKFFLPVLDPQTRTMRVFVEVPNRDLALKPGMLGAALLTVDEGERLAVPEGAVMGAGGQPYAFVDRGSGTLTPVRVTLGARSAGYYAILSGLENGDRVVTSANFLLDSESSLKAALEAVSDTK